MCALQQGAIIRTLSTPSTIIRKEKPKQQDEEFATAISDEFNKEDDEANQGSPNRPVQLCPLTGEILNPSEDKTGSADENSMPDVDDEGLMHVAVSPGGSYHQIAPPNSRKTEKTKQTARSLLTQRRTFEAQNQQQQQVEVQQQEQAEPELISIEGEDGVIYQITPEQQQLLLQNGTITMDSSQDEVGVFFFFFFYSRISHFFFYRVE